MQPRCYFGGSPVSRISQDTLKILKWLKFIFVCFVRLVTNKLTLDDKVFDVIWCDALTFNPSSSGRPQRGNHEQSRWCWVAHIRRADPICEGLSLRKDLIKRGVGIFLTLPADGNGSRIAATLNPIVKLLLNSLATEIRAKRDSLC